MTDDPKELNAHIDRLCRALQAEREEHREELERAKKDLDGKIYADVMDYAARVVKSFFELGLPVAAFDSGDIENDAWDRFIRALDRARARDRFSQESGYAFPFDQEAEVMFKMSKWYVPE